MGVAKFRAVWFVAVLCACFLLSGTAGLAQDATATDADPAAAASSDAPTSGPQSDAPPAGGGNPPGPAVASPTAALVLEQVDPATHRVFAHPVYGRTSLALTVDDAALLSMLANAQPGDTLVARVDKPLQPGRVTGIVRIERPVSDSSRLIALSVTAIVLFLVVGVVTAWRPQAFIIGVDNRYSDSQFQLALSFGMVGIAYGATLALRVAVLGTNFIGDIAIPANLMVLSGISALSFGGAKGITTNQVNEAVQNGDPGKLPADKPRFFKDLFYNDAGGSDLGDFQMILISVVTAVIFMVRVYSWLGTLDVASPVTLPDIDSTLLAGFGVGQGAYLTKKAMTNLGQ